MLKSNFLIARCLLTAVLLSCSVKAIQFDCTFAIYLSYPLGYRYCCDAVVFNGGSASLERVTGNHHPGKTNDDVVCLGLRIRDQHVKFVPQGIADFFKNLDTLRIYYSNVMSISASDLRPFPRLVNFQLEGNNLTSLDGDLFKYNLHLQIVSFSKNQIQQIGHDLVNNLNSLTELRFAENPCINQQAYDRAAVLKLAPQLSVLCPPLDANQKIKEQAEKIQRQDAEIEQIKHSNERLSEENQQQSEKIDQQNRVIEKLIQEKAAFKKRLLEVETKLRKIGSMIYYN